MWSHPVRFPDPLVKRVGRTKGLYPGNWTSTADCENFFHWKWSPRHRIDIVNTRAIICHRKNSRKFTGCGCRAAFLPSADLPLALRPICHFCSWHLFNYISFITMFHICFLSQTACFSLRPICHLPFGQSATCPSPHRSCSAFLYQLDFFHVHISYLFPLSDCMFRPSPDLPLSFAQFTSSLRPILKFSWNKCDSINAA